MHVVGAHGAALDRQALAPAMSSVVSLPAPFPPIPGAPARPLPAAPCPCPCPCCQPLQAPSPTRPAARGVPPGRSPPALPHPGCSPEPARMVWVWSGPGPHGSRSHPSSRWTQPRSATDPALSPQPHQTAPRGLPAWSKSGPPDAVLTRPPFLDAASLDKLRPPSPPPRQPYKAAPRGLPAWGIQASWLPYRTPFERRRGAGGRGPKAPHRHTKGAHAPPFPSSLLLRRPVTQWHRPPIATYFSIHPYGPLALRTRPTGPVTVTVTATPSAPTLPAAPTHQPALDLVTTYYWLVSRPLTFSCSRLAAQRPRRGRLLQCLLPPTTHPLTRPRTRTGIPPHTQAPLPMLLQTSRVQRCCTDPWDRTVIHNHKEHLCDCSCNVVPLGTPCHTLRPIQPTPGVVGKHRPGCRWQGPLSRARR